MMETILPFIIAAFVFGFQIYANFKKEQEKARKRRPHQSPADKGSYQPLKRETLRKEVLKEPSFDYVNPEKKAYYEDFTGVVEVEEVRRAKEIHKKHEHAYRRLEPYKLDAVEEEINPYAEFDLKDAVIKAAILNRPSY